MGIFTRSHRPHGQTVTTTTTTTTAPAGARTTGRKPSLMQRLKGNHKSHTTKTHAAGPRVKKTKVARANGTTKNGVPRRKTSIGDKVSGMMLKVKGSATHRPGEKAAGKLALDAAELMPTRARQYAGFKGSVPTPALPGLKTPVQRGRVFKPHKFTLSQQLLAHVRITLPNSPPATLSLSQPRNMSVNYLQKLAIVGAGGQFGKFITKALVEGGKHKITAITRSDSNAEIPKDVNEIKKVDYDSHASLVEALKGQDALIITMKAASGPTAQTQLINAAKDAGVQWIMPNEYGYDPANNKHLREDTSIGQGILAIREHVEKAGLSWVGLSCGFWYEFSLAGTEARYGFDFSKKALTLIDDGNTKIPTSTWPQAALAIARLFALPIQSDGKSSALSDFKNRAVCVDSFFIDQRDMFASVLRVTGDKESDWTITSEPSKPRYERGVKMMSEGDFEGFVISLYTRVFFPDGASDFTSRLNNKDLDLPQESLDDATKTALEMVKVSTGHWSHHW